MNIKEKQFIEFEDILLEALAFAHEINQPHWQEFLVTVLAAIQENLEDEFAILCESFIRKTLEEKKENQQLMPLHFIINRVGNA